MHINYVNCRLVFLLVCYTSINRRSTNEPATCGVEQCSARGYSGYNLYPDYMYLVWTRIATLRPVSPCDVWYGIVGFNVPIDTVWCKMCFNLITFSAATLYVTHFMYSSLKLINIRNIFNVLCARKSYHNMRWNRGCWSLLDVEWYTSNTQNTLAMHY